MDTDIRELKAAVAAKGYRVDVNQVGPLVEQMVQRTTIEGVELIDGVYKVYFNCACGVDANLMVACLKAIAEGK